MTILAVSAVVVLLVVAVGLIWLVPKWQVDRWRRAGVTEEKLAELSVQARSSITQAFGGLALVATLAITAYQVTENRRSSENTLRLAERGQLAQRYAEAVEQLGANDAEGDQLIDVRTGALFSLRAIGLDSKDFAESAFFTVAAYVTNNYLRPERLNQQENGCDEYHQPTSDVVTALRFVLPNLSAELALPTNAEDPDAEAPDLRGASLPGLGIHELKLERFDLSGISFRRAFLNAPHFRESTLLRADFGMACLRKAELQDADLRWAILVRTDLRNANLMGADLREAQLKGADLRGAELKGADLRNAHMRGAKLFERDLADADLSNEQLREIVRMHPVTQ